MAQVIGLIGSVHGKLGNTVFTVRRGKQISRVYTDVVANPKSARQQLSRAKMRLAVSTFRPFIYALRAGWNKVVPGYEFQKAIGIAIPNGNGVITHEGMDIDVDAMGLAICLAAPLLEPIAVNGLDFSEENQIGLRVAAPASAFIDDQGNPTHVGAVVVAWNKDDNSVVTKMEVISNVESGSPVTVKVPERWSGMDVNVYAFVKQIPEGVNGIDTDTLPWRFPAKTSAAVYAGHGEVA